MKPRTLTKNDILEKGMRPNIGDSDKTIQELGWLGLNTDMGKKRNIPDFIPTKEELEESRSFVYNLFRNKLIRNKCYKWKR